MTVKPETNMNKVIAVWIVGAIINLCLIAAVVYVAWHFISKFW